MFTPKWNHVQYKPVFNLGFDFGNDDDDQSQSCSLPGVNSSQSVLENISKTQKPTRHYHELRQELQMELLAHKKFAPETEKKIHWVTNMYHQW